MNKPMESPQTLNGFNSRYVTLCRLVSWLPERERDVLVRRYGLVEEPQTLQAIATVYGVTRARIQQIQQRAESRIAWALAKSHTPPM